METFDGAFVLADPIRALATLNGRFAPISLI
jgi:hypothetical protein